MKYKNRPGWQAPERRDLKKYKFFLYLGRNIYCDVEKNIMEIREDEYVSTFVSLHNIYYLPSLNFLGLEIAGRDFLYQNMAIWTE